MDKIKYVKLEQLDGSYSDSIPLAVDSDYVDVNGNTLTNELNNKATKDEVQAVASGSPAGVYATVLDLTTADPDHSKIYVVSATGHWYYYTNSQWNDGGVYQASEIGENSIKIDNLDTKIINDLYLKSANIYNKDEALLNKSLITWNESITTANAIYDKTGWFVSSIIEVAPTNILKIYAKNNDNSLTPIYYNNIIFFDENNDFLSLGTANVDTIEVPSNAKFMMFDSNDLTLADKIMVCTNDYDISNGYLEFGYARNFKQNDEIENLIETETSKSIKNILNQNKTYIMFSFDGFRPDSDDTRYVLMKERNFPCFICLSASVLNYPLSKETYYRLINDNVELSVYYGVGDRPSSYTDSSQQQEWDSWIGSLVNGLKQSSGVFEPIIYSCPNNTTGINLQNALKKNGFLLSRANANYKTNETEVVQNIEDYMINGLEKDILPCVPIIKNTTLQQIKTYIDYAISNKKSIILMTHYVLPENDADTYDAIDTVFEDILDYVKEKQDNGNLEVVSPSQFYNIYNPGGKADYKEKKRIQLRTQFDFINQ